jgi:hypothetical protein
MCSYANGVHYSILSFGVDYWAESADVVKASGKLIATIWPYCAPAVQLGALEVGEHVRARWAGFGYKGDRCYDAVITSIDAVLQTCALVFPVDSLPEAAWYTDAACPRWKILRDDGSHAAQRPRQPLRRPLQWQHDGMVKSFFTPQTEMKQTDAQRLMFSWKKDRARKHLWR